MADLSDNIEEAAQGPKHVQTDAGSIDAQSLPDLIAADKYLKGQKAVSGKSGWGALRPTRVIPPGSIGPSTG